MSPAVQIGSIFAKDVNRPIERIIKADDAEHLQTEIDEYVLTNETASALSDLLESYIAPIYGGGNGVWISGFYGSGKSHLLKMLAHLLGDVPDQTYPREAIIDAFKEKAADDAMLSASLTRTSRIPATSLLFNIDQKAPLIDKNQTDALLQVFLKVFNEARGYYGGEPSVARFERDLDRRGLLSAFKRAYEEVAGKPWEEGREEGVYEESNAAQAWSQVTGETATNILSRYEDQFRLSIEDFANEVADWLARQSPEYRLLFMVDEVGQFIGNDTKLMLNLQTIVESLNTKCGGQAWVFVTSQEDVEGVIGDRTKWQANDFSKIQARFITRMKLTSRDVAEVIEKRLLEKNASGVSALADLYDHQQANFRTLFEFVDGAKTYRTYQDPEDFIGTYPLVPYQFPLYQAALVGLSEHEAFEGRHTSVGERSMLGVAQDVVKKLRGENTGALVPFDMMFEDTRSQVKSGSIRNIINAEQQLQPGNDLAIRLLKALYLVKYVKGFNATSRNLRVLLLDRFDMDATDFGRQVVTALDMLEQQTYLQRNGSTYEYLTNEEQEIEQEIKATEIDSVEVSKLLARIISEDVARATSFVHQSTGRIFRYELRLDDASYSRAQPLAVHYISPAFGQSREVIQAQSMGRDEVRVVLASDPRLYSDLRLYVQTEKYVRQKRSSSLTETQTHILDTKVRLNHDRRKELIARVKETVSNSEFIYNGGPISVSAIDPEARLLEGVSQLVANKYPHLSLLGGVTYGESDIARIITAETALIGRGSDKLQPAAYEVGTYVVQQRRIGTNVTVKRLVEHFENDAFGWPLAAILCATARLFATGYVTLTLDGHLLKRTEVIEALRNGAKHPNIVVSEQRQFDSAKVQQARSFAQQFFSEGGVPTDNMDLASWLRDSLAAEQRDLQRDRDAYIDSYPFMTELDEPIGLLSEVVGRPLEWYLDEFTIQIDGLLDTKEDAIDPIRQFLKGSQKEIYDSARRLLTANRDNLPYLNNGAAETVRALLEDSKTFRGAGIVRLKDAASALGAATESATRAERYVAKEEIDGRWLRVQDGDTYRNSSDPARASAELIVTRALTRAATATSIPVIRQIAEEFSQQGYAAVLNAIEAGLPPGGDDESDAPIPAIISIRTLPTPTGGLLVSTRDADAYVEELRAILHHAINDGKRVSL